MGAVGPRAACLVVFASSACTLAIEIVAGRILAPHIGVSLYTWTSIIGVVLSGIALGSFVGGRVADRGMTHRGLAGILLAGGLASLLVLPLTSLAEDRLLFRLQCASSATMLFGALCTPQITTFTRVVLLSAAIFFLPSCILGMVTPVALRQVLRNLGSAGTTVGQIYASGTLGSLLGAFGTGFWLISAVGTRMVVLCAGLVLVGMAAVVGRVWIVRRPLDVLPSLLGCGLVALTLIPIQQRGALRSGCYRETDYFCIRVTDQAHERGNSLRSLRLDHLVHSYTALDNPTYYEYSYIRTYAELADYVAQRRPDFGALFIGGGGYTLPRGLEFAYPTARLDVIEIDPGVTQTVYEKMGVAADTRIVSHNLDARLAVDQLRGGPGYDLVFGDAFNDLSVPYHLTTLEFNRQIRALLREDGWYVINVIDSFRGGLFLPSMVRTLRFVFPHVYLLAAGEPWKSTSASQGTYVVAASATPLDSDQLARVRPQGVGGRLNTSVMPSELLEEWLAASQSVVLTDDYAPTDNLLAPLFAERGL